MYRGFDTVENMDTSTHGQFCYCLSLERLAISYWK